MDGSFNTADDEKETAQENQVSKHVQTEDNCNILELKVTSNAISAFRTENLIVYKIREVNQTTRV